ncbi:fibronectin type III domain-containing protein, partial [Endozoicomonas sp. SM1973]|nr:fibronectin type III domain-containing protein [Spartinivicinus marinus]
QDAFVKTHINVPVKSMLYFKAIKTKGPEMRLYIDGKYNSNYHWYSYHEYNAQYAIPLEPGKHTIEFRAKQVSAGGYFELDNLIIPALPETDHPLSTAPVSLNNWQEYDYEGGSAGDWRVSDNGRYVKQHINGEPTFFISDFELAGNRFEGKFKVEDTGDDDFIGFVFGFKDLESPFYLFSWKKNNQGAAKEGFSIIKIVKPTSNRDYFWNLTSNEHIKVLSQTFASDRGWAPHKEYRFSLSYQVNGNIRVHIYDVESGDLLWDSGLIVDEEPIGLGKVGFYNFSQEDVVYEGFTTATLQKPIAKLPKTIQFSAKNTTAVIDASKTTDLDSLNGHSQLTFKWDINNDGSYEFEELGQPALSVALTELISHGLAFGQKLAVKLTVTDADGLSDEATTQISLKSSQPTIEITKADELITANQPFNFTVKVNDLDNELGLGETTLVAVDKKQANSISDFTNPIVKSDQNETEVTIPYSTIYKLFTDGYNQLYINVIDSQGVINSTTIPLTFAKPDIQLEDKTIKGNFIAGEPVEVNAELVNKGKGPAGNQWDLCLYLSGNNTIDDADTLLGKITGDYIDANGSIKLTHKITWPDIDTGKYHILLKANCNQAQAEDEIDNNTVDTGVYNVQRTCKLIELTSNTQVLNKENNSWSGKLVFNRPMNTGVVPKVLFKNSNGQTIKTLESGTWQSDTVFVTELVSFDKPIETGLQVSVVDAADDVGNKMLPAENQLGIEVDTIEPAVPTITAPKSELTFINSYNFRFTGTAPANTVVQINQSEVTPVGDQWQLLVGNLKEGANEFVISSKDKAGNHSATITRKIIVDTVRPTINQFTPKPWTNQVPKQLTIHIEESGSGVDIVNSRILVTRNNVILPVETDLSTDGKQAIITYGEAFLEGAYHIKGFIVDKAGNQSTPINYQFTIDYSSPKPLVFQNYPAVTASKKVLLKGRKEAGAAVYLEDKQVFNATDSSVFSYEVELTPGINHFQFKQADKANNFSEPTNITIRFDDQAPGKVVASVNGEGSGTVAVVDWQGYDVAANGNDIAQYHIYLSDQPFTSVAGLTPLAKLPATQKQYQLTGLQRNKTVYVAVIAVDQQGLLIEAVESKPVEPKDTEAPPAITQIKVEATDKKVRVNWQPVTESDVVSYKLYWSPEGSISSESNAVKSKTIAVDKLKYVNGWAYFDIAGLKPATAYQVKITAIDQEGNESTANPRQAVTYLNNPAGLSAEPNDSRATLTWSAVQPTALIKQYKVYVSDTTFNSVSGLQPKLVVNKNQLTGTITGLQNDHPYFVAVTAVNTAGVENPVVQTIQVTPVADQEGPEIESIRFIQTTTTHELNNNQLMVTGNGRLAIKADDSSGISRVEFSLQGERLATVTNGSPDYLLPLQVSQLTEGDNQLLIKLFDHLENVTEKSIILTVELAAPTAPVLTIPANVNAGINNRELRINRDEFTLSGTSEVDTTVTVLVNDTPIAEAITVGSTGRFSQTISLQEGENVIKAAARYIGHAKASQFSQTIKVTVDHSQLPAPGNFTGMAKRLGQVALSWQPIHSDLLKGYAIYRSTTDFTRVDQPGVVQVNNKLLTTDTGNDTLAEDGQYVYRVAAINQLGTVGELSKPITITADSTAPVVEKIEYQPEVQMDGIFGVGSVAVVVTFSEPLRNTPHFAIAVPGSLPLTAELTADYDNPRVYKGHFDITSNTPSGTGHAIVTAHDAAGNRGTEIQQGKSINIDTLSPEIAKLVINPSAPIVNQVDETGNGQRVEVLITLKDTVRTGTQPILIPYIEDQNSRQVLADYADGISLTLDPQSQPNQPVYIGYLTLPADVGLDNAGEPVVEYLGFDFQAEDRLGNQATGIKVKHKFQVYQGDLPPLTAPTGVAATALAGGKVQLNWHSVAEADGYVVYRKNQVDEDFTSLIELTNAELANEAPGYLDGKNAPLVDGNYWYAIATIRKHNGQRAESALSEVVKVVADGEKPQAPTEFKAQLTGKGVVAEWQVPAGELQNGQLRYQLYRLPLTSLEELTTLADYQPVLTPIKGLKALDSAPSINEHLYFVTAIDPAGNESAPSNAVYLNTQLLPVADVKIRLPLTGKPEISWQHNGQNINGYKVGAVDINDVRSLHDQLLPEPQFVDSDYVDSQLNRGQLGERIYQIKAVDNNGKESLAHDIALPALSTELTTVAGEQPQLYRGIMNKLQFRVANLGKQTVNNVKLKISLSINGKTYIHWSDGFTVEADNITDVPVVIGGYEQLPGVVTLTMETIWQPHWISNRNPGQQVTIVQEALVTVSQAGVEATIIADEFVRGAVGKARLQINNPTDVAIELLMAKGKQPSTEVRWVLEDLAGNILSTAPVKQLVGDVVQLPNKSVVARVAPDTTFTSAVTEIPVPAAAPDVVVLKLEVDKLHYQLSKPTSVAISGTQASYQLTLQETPYIAEVTTVDKTELYEGETVTIKGRAVERANNNSVANVPVKVVLSVRGFEREYSVYANETGEFNLTFTPGRGETGEYTVSVLHPSMLTRPQQATFVVKGVEVWPAKVNVSIPRNYQQPIKLNVKAGHHTALSNIRLKYRPQLAENGEAVTAPAGVNFNSVALEQLVAEQQGVLSLTLSGNNLAPASGQLLFDVLATDESQEKLVKTVQVNYTFTQAKPALKAEPSYIRTGLARGEEESLFINLSNVGQETARQLTLALQDSQGQPAPDWITLGTPAQFGDLQPGIEQSIQLLVQPNEQVVEGEYQFNLVVSGENWPAQSIPVFVAVSQSGKGQVHFQVADIYTNTFDENGVLIPGLVNTSIQLQNVEVPSITFEGKTDQNGELLIKDITAGRYSYRASAFDHKAATGTLWIKPGITTAEEVFMMNQLISIEFSVKEITLEDRYDIVLNATYETHVPAPVVVFEPMSINLPTMEKGDIYQGEITLTNYGLIKAESMKANLPAGDNFAQIEYLTEIPEELEPGQVVVIPFKVRALKDFVPKGDGEATGAGCINHRYEISVSYKGQCANGQWVPGGTIVLLQWSAAGSCSTSSGGTTGGGAHYYYGGGGGWGTSYFPSPTTTEGPNDSFCGGGGDDPCSNLGGSEPAE